MRRRRPDQNHNIPEISNFGDIITTCQFDRKLILITVSDRKSNEVKYASEYRTMFISKGGSEGWGFFVLLV